MSIDLGLDFKRVDGADIQPFGPVAGEACAAATFTPDAPTVEPGFAGTDLG